MVTDCFPGANPERTSVAAACPGSSWIAAARNGCTPQQERGGVADRRSRAETERPPAHAHGRPHCPAFAVKVRLQRSVGPQFPRYPAPSRVIPRYPTRAACGGRGTPASDPRTSAEAIGSQPSGISFSARRRNRPFVMATPDSNFSLSGTRFIDAGRDPAILAAGSARKRRSAWESSLRA